MNIRLSRKQIKELGIDPSHGKAIGPKVVRHRMNGLERAYAKHLDLRVKYGKVGSYHFESIKFRLADRTWYTPDFAVYLPDGRLECHEVKGFWRDDARVKIKVAAEMFPFRFIGVRRVDGRWVYEEFGSSRTGG